MPAQQRAWFLPEHSVTMRHPTWPCEIDVHSYYPGFLADPSVVFDVLWESRTEIVLGGQPIPVGDPAGNAAILALHSLRAGGAVGQDPAYTPLVAAVRSYDPDLRQDLSDIAAATGALETLGPFLREVEAPAPRVPVRRGTPADLEAWSLLCEAGTQTTGAALVYELTRTRMWRWPRDCLAQLHARRGCDTPGRAGRTDGPLGSVASTIEPRGARPQAGSASAASRSQCATKGSPMIPRRAERSRRGRRRGPGGRAAASTSRPEARGVVRNRCPDLEGDRRSALGRPDHCRSGVAL